MDRDFRQQFRSSKSTLTTPFSAKTAFTNCMKPGNNSLTWWEEEDSSCKSGQPTLQFYWRTFLPVNTSSLNIFWPGTKHWKSLDSPGCRRKMPSASIASPVTALPTRRSILSFVAKLYDPLAVPVVIIAKILLQELWLLRNDWDAPIPQELM